MIPFHATRFVLAAAAAGLLVAGVARAQDAKPDTAPPAATAPAPAAGPGHGMGPGGHHGRMHGQRMDIDRDGAVSRTELLDHQKRQLERFDLADSNKDGKLTRDERRAFHVAHAGEAGHGHGHGHRHRGDAPPATGAAPVAPAAPPAATQAPAR